MERDLKKIKVLLSRNFPSRAKELLEQAGFSVTPWEQDRPMTSAELIEKVKTHNALLCGGTDKIDSDFLNASRHLEIISTFAVGYDNVNVAEATRLGIPFCNTPNAMSHATADIAFGLMIATSRKMFYMHKTILNGEWKYFRPNSNLGIELRNKTLGIFGLGRIGTEMANRCVGAYHMKVIYVSRKPNLEAEKSLGARRVSFDDLLSQSDVLSVHSVLSEETNGIFNAAAFGKMKPTSIFINTSRGPLHNELDLIQALGKNQIWGAGLDVTNPEPMLPDNPLLSMENVCILPHVGSATVEARTEMARMAAENIIRFYKENKFTNLVNPEVQTK